MASRRERFIGVFEFSIRVARQPDHPIEVTVEDFDKLHEALADARSAGERLSRKIDEDRLVVVLDDIAIDKQEQSVCLLFTVVDADAADAVYRNIRSDKETIYRKGPDEGGAASAHLAISLKSEVNCFRYRAGLEDVEGVSRSRILPFLTDLLRANLGQAKVVIDGETFSGDPVAELHSVHKDRITDAAGRPVSVELVHLEPRRRLDGVGEERYRETKKTVEFAINGKRSPADRILSLIDIRERQKRDYQGYPLMRIRWKRPDKRTQTLRINDIAEDLMQRAFTRLEVVNGFEEDLLSATKRIRKDLSNKMLKVITDGGPYPTPVQVE